MSSRIYSRRYETAAALSRRQRLAVPAAPPPTASDSAPPSGRLMQWAQRLVAMLF